MRILVLGVGGVGGVGVLMVVLCRTACFFQVLSTYERLVREGKQDAAAGLEPLIKALRILGIGGRVQALPPPAAVQAATPGE